MIVILNPKCMNKSQTKDVRMFGTTDECMNQNQAKWENILAIAQVKNQLSKNIVILKELDQKKSSSASNPVTTNKDKQKDLLEIKIEVLKGIILSYAYANEMSELVKRVKLLSKGISKKRETDIEPNVKNFLTLVRELQPQMAGYALTEEMIAEVETIRDQFVALVGAPRSLVVQSSSAIKQIDNLVKGTKDLLTRQLDNLMLRFKASDVDFYNSYVQSRMVVEPATRHREKLTDTPPAV